MAIQMEGYILKVPYDEQLIGEQLIELAVPVTPGNLLLT
jgi:hypothetical protein